MNINEIVSKELQVVPLKAGETREFVLARAGFVDLTKKSEDFPTGKPTNPQGHYLAGKCLIQDPFDKKGVYEKLIQNIVGSEPIKLATGQIHYNFLDKPVHFNQTSRIICTSADNNKYMYLKRHNKNRDNKYRNPDAPIVFYEVDEARDTKIIKNNFEYRTLAANHLLSLDHDGLLLLAMAINKNGKLGVQINMAKSAEEDYLRAAMVPVAEHQSVDFIHLSKNDRLITRLLIEAATEEGVILFNAHEEVRAWSWAPTEKIKKTRDIVKVEAGNKPAAALLDFLMLPEGGTHLAELKNRQKEYYTLVV